MPRPIVIGKIGVFVAMAWACLALPLRAQEPEQAAALERAYVLWQQGYVLHAFGDYESAADHFQESIKVYPTAEGHTFLGWSLSHLGQTEDAIVQCKKAIELDPEYGNPYNDIGVYLIDLGRPDEAIPWLKKAMQAKRYCCFQYPHFNLGRVLLMKGRLEEATRAFERALSYDPDYLPAREALQVIRESEGEAL
jgi:tetratricopeptide (TPR) repeat protein